MAAKMIPYDTSVWLVNAYERHGNARESWGRRSAPSPRMQRSKTKADAGPAQQRLDGDTQET